MRSNTRNARSETRHTGGGQEEGDVLHFLEQAHSAASSGSGSPTVTNDRHPNDQSSTSDLLNCPSHSF